MQNRMSELYELTKKFNTISGSINELSEKAFIEQYTYIREEFNEMATTCGDDKNTDSDFLGFSNTTGFIEPLLDDCLDVIITVFGMLQKLEALGVDINQAAIDTAMNNLSKYPNSPTIAHQTVENAKIEKGIEAVATLNEEHGVYVIRNKHTGKVVKPIDFTSNDLSKFITTKVKEKYADAN